MNELDAVLRAIEGVQATPGTAATIANAVFHATGRRIRELPIGIEHLL